MTKKIVNKIYLCLLAFIMFITVFDINVYAANDEYTCNLELIPDKSKILAGETVTIEIKVSNIQAGNGIAHLNGLLEYDNTVFEEKFKTQTADDGNWTNSVQENCVNFSTASIEPTIEDSVIGKVVLTAKKDVEIGVKEVKFINIAVSSINKKFYIDDISVKIEIVNEDEPGGNNQGSNNQGSNNQGGNNQGSNNQGGNNQGSNNQGSNNQGSNNQGSNNQGSNNQGSNNQGSNNQGSNNQGSSNKNGNSNTQTPGNSVNTGKANSILPKTGNANFLVIAIVVAIILMNIFYIKYRRAY